MNDDRGFMHEDLEELRIKLSEIAQANAIDNGAQTNTHPGLVHWSGWEDGDPWPFG